MRFAPIKIKNRWAESGRYIHKKSKRLKFLIPLSGESVNAIIYGAWDLSAIINPAMTQIWQWYKKDEYEKEIS